MILLLALACAPRDGVPPATGVPPAAATDRAATCTLLTINDTYRIEALSDGTGGMARVRTAREQLEAKHGDVVLLHAGDFLYPSLMSRTYKGEQMVDVLGALDGDSAKLDPRMYVVFGNHEFDASKVDDGVFLDGLIARSQMRWLGTNVRFAEGPDGPYVADEKLVNSDLFACGGLRVGLFGVTTDRKSAKFVAGFGDPVEAARTHAKDLRDRGADVVVALTHQSLDEDAALLRTLGAAGPDLVVGGHEHDKQRLDVDGRPIYKADGDARTAWRVTLRRAPDGTIARDEELLALGGAVAEDPAVKTVVDAWLARHDHDFCSAKGQPDGCLAAEVGRTTVPLVAAELEIRRYETNLGGWIADRARAAYPDAQIALVNSGSLRLNRDLAPGPIRRQDVEELFAYPTPLVRLEIDGATLEKVVARAVQEWTGNGHWLQVSGFAWVHDPAAGTGTRLTLLSTGKRIAPTDRLVVVVPDFLADPSTGQDGYTMLPAGKTKGGPDLKQLVLDALAAAPAGIAPAVEGRVCNTQRPGPCLAAP